MVDFCGAKSVPPTSSIKIRNCQKKIGTCICIYMRVYANTWEGLYPMTWILLSPGAHLATGRALLVVSSWVKLQVGPELFWLCSVTIPLHTGMCDHLDVCWCSEKSISTDDFRALLPSRCSLGHSFCQVFTNLFLFYHGFDATSEILFAWFLQICFCFTMVLMLLQAFILPGFCK